jgi:hypothetical protein
MTIVIGRIPFLYYDKKTRLSMSVDFEKHLEINFTNFCDGSDHLE